MRTKKREKPVTKVDKKKGGGKKGYTFQWFFFDENLTGNQESESSFCLPELQAQNFAWFISISKAAWLGNMRAWYVLRLCAR